MEWVSLCCVSLGVRGALCANTSDDLKYTLQMALPRDPLFSIPLTAVVFAVVFLPSLY
ncbi:hypothetical protein [Paraburkholderia bannensis]|uniref:hypothetical protein n=1 Tax=Paraburkholderia bannensis TaxID=765414 RepID=UPI002AB2AEDB|nr:hypothetical protein [Paraburkholderia bannensis]